MHPVSLPSERASKPRARLTEAQVIQIFRFSLDSHRPSSANLATLFRVSEKAVRDIWTGRTWSRETWHLDKTRMLELKQTGRPKGCRDSRPRKKRGEVRIASSTLTGHSCNSSSGPSPIVMIGPTVDNVGPRQHTSDTNQFLHAGCCQYIARGNEQNQSFQHQQKCLSDSHRSDPAAEHTPPSTHLYPSLDEQLHKWDAFWTSPHTADPFASDWALAARGMPLFAR